MRIARCRWSGEIVTRRRLRMGRRCNWGVLVPVIIRLILWSVIGLVTKWGRGKMGRSLDRIDELDGWVDSLCLIIVCDDMSWVWFGTWRKMILWDQKYLFFEMRSSSTLAVEISIVYTYTYRTIYLNILIRLSAGLQKSINATQYRQTGHSPSF